MDISSFKNKHVGDSIVVIATGPSLAKTNFSLLKGKVLFGVNSLYENSLYAGFTCHYYAISDKMGWKRYGKGVLKTNAVLFSPHCDGVGSVKTKTLPGGMWDGRFSKDAKRGLYPGGNVVVSIVLQVIYYLGFSTTYLLGCDCDFSDGHFGVQKENTEEEIAILKTIDPINPFFTNDWWRDIASYQKCKEVFEADGREIINCTTGGRLEVFKRMSLEDI